MKNFHLKKLDNLLFVLAYLQNHSGSSSDSLSFVNLV